MYHELLHPSALDDLFRVVFRHLHHVEVRRVSPRSFNAQPPISSQDTRGNSQEQDRSRVLRCFGTGEIGYVARDCLCHPPDVYELTRGPNRHRQLVRARDGSLLQTDPELCWYRVRYVGCPSWV